MGRAARTPMLTSRVRPNVWQVGEELTKGVADQKEGLYFAAERPELLQHAMGTFVRLVRVLLGQRPAGCLRMSS